MSDRDRLRSHLDRITNNLQVVVGRVGYVRRINESNLADLDEILAALRGATNALEALRVELEKAGAR